MHRYDLISCPECGVLHRKRPVGPREKARCVRCNAVLYRGGATDLNRMAAIVVAAIVTYLIAQFSPIVNVEFNGLHSSSTLLGAIAVLWGEQMEAVATIVFVLTIVLPAVELGALLYVIQGLRAGRRVPGFDYLLRGVSAARHWGMTEVLMIGILISLVKLTGLAQVMVQPGLFAFGALTVMLAIVVSFDPRLLWDLGDQVSEACGVTLDPFPAPDAASAPAMRYTALPGREPLLCHACGLVSQDIGQPRQHCPRCGKTLHRRHPDSVGRTWALLLAAAILYIPAMLLPVMYTQTLFNKSDDTIISGVVYFWTDDAKALATIIFIASIVVPVLKLAALSLLAWTAQRRSGWRPYQRTLLYRMVEFVGRWSMLDIFVITLTVALVRFQTLAVITAGPGALAFCAVVVLTMLASLQFDPRLIWDHVEPRPHAANEAANEAENAVENGETDA